MPTRIELEVSLDGTVRGAFGELGELLFRLEELALDADYPHECLHRLLQVTMHRVGVLVALVGEVGHGMSRHVGDLSLG